MKQDEDSVLKKALNNGQIPIKGSLGLLAFGDLGLKYWRLSIEKQGKKTE
jgi:hypothetical protein